MGRETQARDDIGMALSIDPLNYPAYLNLASIDARQLDYPSAIENLTCAISALRLILGRRTKQRP
jgi:Tfp pilus assembly protein PilF